MKIVLDKSTLINYMNQYNDSVYSLASRMNVSPSTIYRILKSERNVGSSLIVKLLKAFNLNEKDFDKFFRFISSY